VNTAAIKAALQNVRYPGFSRDIVSFGLVRDIRVDGGKASVAIELTASDESVPRQIAAEAKAAVEAVEGIDAAEIEMRISAPQHQPRPAGPGAAAAGGGASPLQKVRSVIAVASGKGGVGKSSVAVNLACAFEKILAEKGKRAAVGIMDCDIYGPSVPLMLGAAGRPEIRHEMIVPIENFGVRSMSMGFLIDEDTPVVWRGPMVMKTIQQFARNVDWGELELLIVDLPPGTGDAQLSLVQTLPLDGAVIVTTPQPAATNVARRGARMFGKVNVPLLGVVENMSYFEAPDGSRQELFGRGGGARTAEELETELLGQIPLDPMIRTGGDNGIPIVIGHPDSAAAREFEKVAAGLCKKLFDK
jgi:ATP-binding protein involved in chromosome partitioning